MKEEIESDERKALIGRSGVSKRASERISNEALNRLNSSDTKPKIYCTCTDPKVRRSYTTRTAVVEYCGFCSLLIKSNKENNDNQ
jgi:hypothetical protein